MTLKQCQQEIIEVHRFFQDWFNGDVPEGEEAFSRFSGVLSPQFHMIPPGGQMLERQNVLQTVLEAWGSSGGKMAIETKNHILQYTKFDVSLLTYEEWQTTGNMTKTRLSTVLFQASEGVPNGVEWIHVHETWIPETAD